MRQDSHPVRLGICALIGLLAGCVSHGTRPLTAAANAPPQRLNPYILSAVAELNADYGARGYANAAFTHNLRFGNQGELKATQPPGTMCVATQLEVLVEALNRYAQETGDYSAFAFLPKATWEHIRPTDFRGEVWMVKGAHSNGAADALQHFGMGAITSFEAAQPGDFINFNRVSGSGHGVVFLAYLDRQGHELPVFGPDVVGFKYFSAQGTATDGGLGYRYAFFYPQCPIISADRKRDCGVIRSASERLFIVGFAQLPSAWNHAAAEAALTVPGAAAPAVEGTFDIDYFTGVTTDN